jgi:hypothetical protein
MMLFSGSLGISRPAMGLWISFFQTKTIDLLEYFTKNGHGLSLSVDFLIF